MNLEPYVQEYALEWIVRCRPSFVLPVSCYNDSGQVRLLYHTEGLMPLAEYAQACLPGVPYPSRWVRMLLNAIRETLACAEDYLLDARQFRLDTDSVWFRMAGLEMDAPAPILTYLPLYDARPEGGLSAVADELLRMIEELEAPIHPDEEYEPFLLAVQRGDEHLLAYLERETVRKQAEQDRGQGWPQNTAGGQAQFQPGLPARLITRKRLLHIAFLSVSLGIPFMLSVLPLVLRFGPEPVRQLTSFSAAGYRVIAAVSLGLTAVFDAVLLFAPGSPFRLSSPNAYKPPIGSHNQRSGYLKALREEIRFTGLLPALASRLGKGGRLGAMTHPLTVDDGSERLGFLSEGEPGTANEAEGIRAYLLTSEFLIGRDPDMVDLAVPDASIGRVHARIIRQDGVFFLTDLGSVNGTRLDGKRLDRHEQMLLPDRCRIQFAERAFHFLAD